MAQLLRSALLRRWGTWRENEASPHGPRREPSWRRPAPLPLPGLPQGPGVPSVRVLAPGHLPHGGSELLLQGWAQPPGRSPWSLCFPHVSGFRPGLGSFCLMGCVSP